MKKIAVFLFNFLFLFSSFSATMDFKFQVLSSGNDIYACNAGIRHQIHSSRVCYDRETLRSCSTDTSCNDREECNCVCTGGETSSEDSTNNDNNGDFLKATYVNWSERSSTGLGERTRVSIKATDNFTSIFENGIRPRGFKTTFQKQLTSLQFDLGSERYGAEYYIDFCFRSSQVTMPTDLFFESVINRKATVTDISGDSEDTFGENNQPVFSEDPYHFLSDLNVRSLVFCRNKNNEAVIDELSDYFTFNTSQSLNFSVLSTAQDLKHCVIRYQFSEKNRHGLDSIRRWKLQNAQISTLTGIEKI